MPGLLVHVGALTNCPHVGTINIPPSSSRVFVNGTQAVLTKADIPTIAGCTFTVGTKPQPCVRVQLESATRVFIGGFPASIMTPVALCFSAESAPQGPPGSTPIQTRVTAA